MELGRQNVFIVTLLFLILHASCDRKDSVSALYEMRENHRSEVHWKFDTLAAKGSTVLNNINGEGVINRLWCTFLPTTEEENNYLGRALVLNIYWDDGDTPAVSVPIADFFCQPLKLQAIDNHFFNSSNEYCVFNSLVPMPFRKNARIEIINDTEQVQRIWYEVDVEYKKLKSSSLYLHAYWHRSDNVPLDSGIIVLPKIKGKGRYLGTHMAVNQQKVRDKWLWYSRPVFVNLDKKHEDDQPFLHVYSLDDFLCSGWWSREKEYKPFASRFTGRPFVQIDSADHLSLAMYRYHVQDPLWFKESVSFQIGPADLQTLARSDWSTTSYFYLDKPTNPLPPIQDVNIRTEGLK
ncbi:MAG: DUF2961 domain-containing protein [Bacteroidota bacterium]